MTASHVALIVALQYRESARLTPLPGLATAALIALGAMEGPALALGLNGTPFALSAMTGYMALSLWMITSGLVLLGFGRRQSIAA